MTLEIADRIRNVRFTAVRINECYAMAEVDNLLSLLESAVRGGEPLAPLFVDVDLPLVRMREGYDIAEVDAFLAALRDGTPLPPEPEKKAGLLSRLFGRG